MKSPDIGIVGAGLEDAAASFADGSTTFGAIHYKTGEPIWFSERSIEEAFETRGALTRHMHRAGLHKVLEDSFDKGGGTLRLGHALTGMDAEFDYNAMTAKI